jgi:hypothetical protein
MQSPDNLLGFEVCVFSTPSTACTKPNQAVKPTPILAMASPFLWPVLVPSALSGSGAAYLGR